MRSTSSYYELLKHNDQSPHSTTHLAECWALCPFAGCTVTLESSVSVAKHIS